MMMEQSFNQEARREVGSVYQRELPGGGYVKIDVLREEETRTCVFVERRAKHERRPGHRPVIIAQAVGDERSPAFFPGTQPPDRSVICVTQLLHGKQHQKKKHRHDLP